MIRVREGQVIGLEARVAFDGQVPSTTMAEVAQIALERNHALTGPVYVEEAEPGDILEVEILEVEAQPFGFALQGPKFGFLRDIFTDDHLIRWDIRDGLATSPDLPGVRIVGAPFMGVLGVAPSHQPMNTIARREADLAKDGHFVALPTSEHSVPDDPVIAEVALRTLPPREFGGNMDIKQLTKGARLRLPVFVPGALFSAGDGHFARGDNECCTAIEMSSTLYCRFKVIKAATARRAVFEPEFYREDYFALPELAVPRRFFATTGLSRKPDRTFEPEDLNLAARNALLNMIRYLVDERGYTRQQAYAICSVAVDLRISAAVNAPNYLVSAFLPLDIFI